MKRILLIMVALALSSGAWAKPIQWETDYDKALKDAAAGRKLVMIDFYTDWCGWCKKLDKDVYADAKIEEKLGAGFIAMKLNPEKSKRAEKLSKEFGTRGYPHIVFVDGTGKKVDEIKGYVPAKAFGEILDRLAKKQTK